MAAHPQLAAEWHPTKNGDLRPDLVVAGTSEKLWWRCLEHPEHEWQATGANRTRGRRCPRCTKHLRSALEVCLAFELAQFFPLLDPTNSNADDKVVIDGVVRHVDLLIRDCGPSDRHRTASRTIIIEVDGRYRHGGQVENERDAAKTALLLAAGYLVLRVREHPLPPITANDVVVPTDATVKQAADAVLSKLRHLEWALLPELDAYLAEPKPRRVEDALEHLRTERPGKSIRLPGPAAFTRADRWEGGLAVLSDFVGREGHANVPWEHVENGFALGKWVGAKRAQHRRGRMIPGRVATLEALPGWTWDPVSDEWEAGYQRLLAFRDREGHLNVPAHYWDPDGFPLGSWVRSHRRPGGGRRTMSPEQSARLRAIPGWTFTPPAHASWAAGLAALEAFAGREGHCRLPTAHREDGIDIDSWAARQRALFRRGRLARHRVVRLEAIPGWSWQPAEAACEAGFSALAVHVEAAGSAAVRRDLVIDGYPIGAWVGEQRTRLREGGLPDERRRRLEQLPGWVWHRHQDSWERHYTALRAFVDREGHAKVPTGHVEAALPLAAWVIRHRQEYKAGTVPADRVTLLEALPGWTWDVLATRWEERFAALEAFTAREGDARVPSNHNEGAVKLGRWVISQRQQQRKGDLDAGRRARLEAVAGWTWHAGSSDRASTQPAARH